jgi:hypothetical protein
LSNVSGMSIEARPAPLTVLWGDLSRTRAGGQVGDAVMLGLVTALAQCLQVLWLVVREVVIDVMNYKKLLTSASLTRRLQKFPVSVEVVGT